MHLVIVEDLDPDCRRLEALIRQDCSRHGCPAELSICYSGEEFLEHYPSGSCDGVFLDILLPGISGVDTARRIRESQPRLPIVFTTTEPDFALEGFSVHAMDYLVKPVDEDKVSWCLSRLREYLAVPLSVTIPRTLSRGHCVPEEILLDRILYGQYWKHAMEIHTPDGVLSTRLSFRSFIGLLPDSGQFAVCSRDLAVNLSHVSRVGDGELMLDNGERITFSRSRNQTVQKAFGEWAFRRARKGGWI